MNMKAIIHYPYEGNYIFTSYIIIMVQLNLNFPHACAHKCKNTHAHANKNAQVYVVHAKQRCKHAVHVRHDAHGSRVTCYVYMYALKMHFYVTDLSCTQKPCCKHFHKCVKSYSGHMHV